MSSRLWTRDESAWLFFMAPRTTVDYCASRLGRSVADCQARLAFLNGRPAPRSGRVKSRRKAQRAQAKAVSAVRRG